MKKVLLISAFLFVFASYSNYILATKQAIIIGASSGIGRALAKVMLENGYIVGLTARRYELLKEVQDEFPNNTFIKRMDLTKPYKAQEQLGELIAEMGGVDIVVVNSGVWGESGALVTSSVDCEIDWKKEKRIIDVNVTGFTAVANVAVNFFREQGYGHLVGVSSVDAVRGSACGPAYSASKSFVSTYMPGLRSKFAQLDISISVTDIRPGYISTYGPIEGGYWVATPEEAGVQILDAIEKKKKVAYVEARWQIIALLLQITPDFIYDKLGGF